MMGLFINNSSKAQSQNWWKIDGNSNGSNSTFIGTTNNAALRFRANNTEWFSISPSGQYTFNGLSDTGNGLLLVSNTGNVYRLNFTGNANEVLTSAGTWQSISNLVPQYWILSGNNSLLSQNNLNVGIGTTDPKEKLQIGDEFVFHDGGTKVIARNFYHDGQDKRIKSGVSSALYFGDDGLIFKVSGTGSASSVINWREV